MKHEFNVYYTARFVFALFSIDYISWKEYLCSRILFPTYIVYNTILVFMLKTSPSKTIPIF